MQPRGPVVPQEAEEQRTSGDEPDRQLPEAGEDMRRDYADEDATEVTANRRKQVERRPVARGGPKPIDLAVAHHAAREKDEQECGDLAWHREAKIREVEGDHQYGCGGVQRVERGPRRPGLALKAYDERQQV